MTMSKIHKTSILVVDDNADLAFLLKKAFLRQGFDVFTATNALNALDILEKISVDVLLTDFLMSDMDGLCLVENAKSLHPHLICYLMTGFYDKDSLDSALARGVENILIKPFDIPIFLESIQAKLKGHSNPSSTQFEHHCQN